jgi:peptidoglycan-associated lipoprotein
MEKERNMRKGMLSLLIVLCCGTLVVGGCAKKQVVKGDETATTAPATPAKPAEPAQPTKPPVKEETVKEQPIQESPIASADQDTRQQGVSGAQQEAALERIFFDYDSYLLTQTARETLNKHAEWLKANSSAKLQIEGHCDERGSDEYNLALGEKRAKSAQNYLVTLGIAKDRLPTISYGKEKPLDQGHDETAWAKNRRAEFLIIR